jgi:hypothetical protein
MFSVQDDDTAIMVLVQLVSSVLIAANADMDWAT